MSKFRRGQALHSHILPGPFPPSCLCRMVHFSLRVLVGEVLQSKDGCPIEHVGHDGGKDGCPMTTCGHDGMEGERCR